jgi:hypothetical protein
VPRPVATVLVIAVIWAAALVAYPVIGVHRFAPNTGYIALIVALWLTALVVYAVLLNPEGLFNRYLVVAAISLAAAAVLVGGLMLLLTPAHTQAPLG